MQKPPTYEEILHLKNRARKIERNKKKHNRRKAYFKRITHIEYRINKKYRDLAKYIKTYDDALNVFLPKNLKYLLLCTDGPFHDIKIEPKLKTLVKTIQIPQKFSIIENETESIKCIRQIIHTLINQECQELWIDYKNCKYIDLLTQIYLDAILKDWGLFVRYCIKASISQFINVKAVGGRNYNNRTIQQMINSVGSPAILINRETQYSDIVPFKLRYFDSEKEQLHNKGIHNEIDSTLLIEYVEKCLSRLGLGLTNTAKSDLGTVIGETVINASEHSSLKSRYLIGYFEEKQCKQGGRGVLHLVILNFGQSIYQKFKNPDESVPINLTCLNQMKKLSSQYDKRQLFKKQEFTEETLWTLYSLQQGVTIIPDKNRGNGTVQFIDKFFKLKGNNDVDSVSRLYILSGQSIIEFDGSYNLTKVRDGFGTRDIMTFNSSGSLENKPDSNYVRQMKTFFPGTAIFARIQINTNNIIN